ncbi:MAG: hypothetical protein OXQ29_08705 [Rhodospirillaceae bacterium]|nr:hypothetical protein [Rhodospirillaceae bacterium]
MADTRHQDLPRLGRRDAVEVAERNTVYKAHHLEADLCAMRRRERAKQKAVTTFDILSWRHEGHAR